MEASLKTLLSRIKRSQSSQAAVIHQQVLLFLEQYTPKKPRKDKKYEAGSSVMSLLITIEQRLKRTPEIDLFKTHVQCQLYLKNLCTEKGSLEGNYGYLERQCSRILCYEHWSKFRDVLREGHDVLREINMRVHKRKHTPTGQVLPTYEPPIADSETVKIVTTIGMAFLRVHWNSIKDGQENEDAFRKFISLVKETELWTVHLDFEERRTFLTFLMECIRSLLKKRPHFMSNWIIELCIITLKQFTSIDEMCDFGKEICSLFLSRTDDRFFNDSTMVVDVLGCVAKRCIEHPQENMVIKFLELAGYCCVNFGAASLHQFARLISLFRRLANESFPLVNVPFASLFMKHLVITLLIKDLNFYRVCGGPDLSKPFSNSDVSKDLEAHLKEWTEFNHEKDLQVVHLFFYSRLSSFILSNGTIDALEDNTLKLPKILDIFDRFIDDFSSDREYKRTHEHIEVAAKLGVAYHMLLLATKQDMKRRDEMLLKLKQKNSCKPEVLNYLIQSLEEVLKALNNNARINEAIESSKLCCMIQWERLLGFCEMLTSTEHGVDDGFSEYTIVGFAEKAYEDSAVLLELLNKHHRDEINEVFKHFLESWFEAEKKFCIPSPAALVCQWVKIQCEHSQENHLYKVSTIYYLVPSPETSYKSYILLFEELNQYQEKRSSNPKLYQSMERLINSLISTRTESYKLEHSNSLIDCGARLASCGSICRPDSIKYINRAISMLHGLENINKSGQVQYLLFMAYCYNALCKRTIHPKLKEFIKDIEAATKVYQSECLAKIEFGETEQKMFYYVADLLAFEGYMDHHSRLYKTMLKRAALKKIDISATLDTAWNSGSLSHSLCASPVDALFMKTLLEHNSSSDGVKFWTDSGVRGSSKVAVDLCLSVFPTISSVDSYADAHAKKAQKTIDEIKSAASTQGSKDFDKFKAARMYYHLAERLIAKGLMTEALTYADKGYFLRDVLLSESFKIEWNRVETGSIRNFDCKKFGIITARVSPSGNNLFSTPWSTVRFYLESALQRGTLHGLIGNIDEAETMFLLGKSIASLLNLPMFEAAFLTSLGKVYRKKGLHKLAMKELKSAEAVLKPNCSSIGCEKCIIIWKNTVNMELGDFFLGCYKTVTNASEESKKRYLQRANELYSQARSNLVLDIWRDNDARLGEETSKIPTFCNAFGILGVCGDETDCWHCRSSLCEKSSSLKASIQIKWECIQRGHLARLATRLGKCYKLQGDAVKEYMHLKSGICVLVSRSTTFNPMDVSTSFVDKLLSKGVMGDAYALEHASILYKICCFSLMNKNKGDKVDKLSIDSILLGLKLAFILSREVRVLRKKVSRVLAVLYAYLSEDRKFSSLRNPSLSQWAFYFHQSSIGNYFNSLLLSQDQNPVEVDALRKVLAPHSLDMLETSVLEFFETLPKFTILCMSMLSDKSDKLLKLLLPESPTSAWIMVSRISAKREPLLIILPVCKTFEDFQFETDDPLVDDHWKCPWAHGVFDKLAPVLRRILEEDYKVLSTKLDNNLVIKYRKMLDKKFKDFLRGLENSWFGSWRYLLLGEWSNNNDLDETVQEIKRGLTSGESVDGRILKAVIEGVESNFKNEEVLINLISNNGCFIKRSNADDELRTRRLTKISSNVRMILKNKEGKICRNPVIFVLDNDIQMFPVENMPLLQKEPIYRMPSVGSVIWASSKRNETKKDKTIIDPRSCFGIIFTNSVDVGKFFRIQSKYPDFEGHCIPLSMSRKKLEELATYGVTLDTLKNALLSHDLFVYAGHGDARQYIPGDTIRKIDESCAVCLFGCNSGYIKCRSSAPDGAPLDYLLSGSRVIISNLWLIWVHSCDELIPELLRILIDTSSTNLVDCSNNQQHLCIHKTDIASLYSRTQEKIERNYGKSSILDFAGTVIYGLPTHIAKRPGEDLSKDHMDE